MLKLKDDAGPERRDEILEARRALPGEIAEILALEAHGDADVLDPTYDLVLVADFEDQDGFRAYLRHPAHRRIAELAAPLVARQAMIQHAG